MLKVREKPNATFATTLIASPKITAGFLPYESETLPQSMLVDICPIGKAATKRPVRREMRCVAVGCSDSETMELTRKKR
jgi:hypothetical protein